MKTRSSSGVGQKVDLEFNVETLRISDLGEDEDNGGSYNQQKSQGGGSSVYAGLKRTSSVTEHIDENGEINPTVGSNLPKSKAANHAAGIRNILATMNSEKD